MLDGVLARINYNLWY